MGEAVFLHYDQAGLDREYDNRGKVPEFPDYLRRYHDASAAARARLKPRVGLPYGASAAETLDWFGTDAGGGARAPACVFIHGGYWKALSKNEFSFVANGLTPAGACVAVIDYALIPSVTMDELVRQCRAALAWVWRNAAELGADPDRLYVAGHSAGGHLTAMTLATDWPQFEPGLPADLVKGACGISGLYDLEPIRRSFLNDELRLDPATAARNSPVALPGPVAAERLLLAVGEREGPEYLRQSQRLAAAWPGAAVEVMTDEDHFSIVWQLNQPDSRLSRLCLPAP